MEIKNGGITKGSEVLATNYRSIAEQVMDGETGLLVANQEPDVLEDQLVRFLHCDSKNRGRLGGAHFGDHFSLAPVQQHLRDTLERVMVL